MTILELASSNFDGRPSLHPERKGQLNLSPLKNWVEKNGGLPTYINSVATALFREKYPAWSISRIIATAVNWAKKACATGKAFGGRVQVSKAVQAAACTAVAQWEKKKASASEEWVDALILELAEEDSRERKHAELRKKLRTSEGFKFIPGYIELSDDDYMKYGYGIELSEVEENEMVQLIDAALVGGGD